MCRQNPTFCVSIKNTNMKLLMHFHVFIYGIRLIVFEKKINIVHINEQTTSSTIILQSPMNNNHQTKMTRQTTTYIVNLPSLKWVNTTMFIQKIFGAIVVNTLMNHNYPIYILNEVLMYSMFISHYHYPHCIDSVTSFT